MLLTLRTDASGKKVCSVQTERKIKMALIVQKFGGTSVGTVEKINHAADRVIEEKKKGNDCVVVVSAMGQTTDQLIQLAKEISSKPPERELDMLLATGEQVAGALFAMALQNKGYAAVSLTGWQAGIQTEAVFGKARIMHIDAKRIEKELAEGKIVVVAGFQGVTDTGEIATLGRGGSDTTAVALAAALKADKCDIYTDVTGVFTTDPRFIKGARKLKQISYDEMLELANLGAGVIHPRAVELAKNYRIPLEIRSSAEREEGTIIGEESDMEENLIVRGVAFEDDVTKVTVLGLPKSTTSLSTIFTTLARYNINVDIIIQSTTEDNIANLSFSIHTKDMEETYAALENNKTALNYESIQFESNLAKVSIVGSGMISNPGVAAQMFEALASDQIPIKMVSTSEIKVSAVVPKEKMIRAAEILHRTFNLEKASSAELVQ